MQFSKYILLLTSVAKVRRFQYYGNEQGMLAFGHYMVKIPSTTECKKISLLSFAFDAVLEDLGLPFDDNQFTNYHNGTSELCKNKDFCEEYENAVFAINQLDFSKYHFVLGGVGAWLALLSFGLVYFSWWFLLTPFFIWVIATASTRQHLINWSASYAILSQVSKPFYNFCKSVSLVQDTPNDLNELTVISDAFGSRNMNIKTQGSWDHQLLSEVESDLDKQDSALRAIHAEIIIKKSSV